MEHRDKLEAALRKSRIAWRRTLESPTATAAERHKAFTAWKKAREAADQSSLMAKRARSERRRSVIDRRRAGSDNAWPGANAERRKGRRR